VIELDRHLKQTFDMRYLNIGNMINGGVVQIGCGAGHTQTIQPVGYSQIGKKLIPLSAPPQFAVPLQAPVRPK
jgi:hypothetical protein